MAYRVIFIQQGQKQSRNFKTEKGALKAIKRWLQQEGSQRSALFYGPDIPHQRYDALEQLPLTDKATVDFYATQRWRQLRYQFLQANLPHRCACCGAKGPQVSFEVDHIKPRSLYSELALDWDNLQILCLDCNRGKSNLVEKD